MQCVLVGDDDAELQRLARIFRECGWQSRNMTSLVLANEESLSETDMVVIRTTPADDEFEGKIVFVREVAPTAIVLAMGVFSVDARMRALALGAADYLPLDVSSRLLVARVSALMRLRRQPDSDVLTAGGLRIDMQHRRIRDSAGELTLSQKEFELLALFVRHHGSTLTRSELMERLWSGSAQAEDNALEVHISRLRRKLNTRFRGHITTVRGVGYRLDA